ncbi:30S ribosomal subunit protein S15 [Candidatus Zinderia insecticola CARI]|uniref:Small ribosomal subunit protein uS15 n=1 Tax=Zinderia insecticola (strain CARI) TaxID=871271 RepID=E0TIV1_ZINIC|nr:30S ribosomal subunit protein S15 [Candidatus Zinderia insecticola CARI]
MKKNSGLCENQIFFFTQKINNLKLHFKKNKKDIHSKIGLLKIINNRKKILSYLKKININRYLLIIKKLNLRK